MGAPRPDDDESAPPARPERANARDQAVAARPSAGTATEAVATPRRPADRPVSPPPPPAPDAPPPGGDEAGDEARTVPVQVHRSRLERQVGRLDLSPTEALKLAEEGRSGLSRRALPPDRADSD